MSLTMKLICLLGLLSSVLGEWQLLLHLCVDGAGVGRVGVQVLVKRELLDGRSQFPIPMSISDSPHDEH